MIPMICTRCGKKCWGRLCRACDNATAKHGSVSRARKNHRTKKLKRCPFMDT